jgi:hypothetical protein
MSLPLLRALEAARDRAWEQRNFSPAHLERFREIRDAACNAANVMARSTTLYRGPGELNAFIARCNILMNSPLEHPDEGIALD